MPPVPREDTNMQTETLNAILAESTKEPPELPRLTVAQTFVHYNRLRLSLNHAVNACSLVPDSSTNDVAAQLKEIITRCEIAIKTANRMLEANR